MPITKLTPENNYPYKEERLKALEQAVPEAFADGKINWQALREVLEADLEDESKDEFFGLNWPGKREARRKASIPSQGTLIPALGEGVNEENTENLFIEGDNLEVLKLLQKSYAGKIKMIYIDPPYNTGNDFVYNDNFTDPLEAYLKYTGSKDESGDLLTTNTRADGRFHSKWLNMMYPRIILARQLLRDDGVIFISIDDNEVYNLRQMLNEIFGEENFISSFIWKRRQNVDSRSKNGASVDHEYVIVFGKTNESKLRGSEIDKNKYSNPDNDPRGPWMSDNMVGLATKEQRPNLHYDLFNPTSGITYQCPPTGWRYEPSRMKTLIENDEVLFPEKSTGRPRRKKFINDLNSEFTGFSTILNTVFNTQGTRELRLLFDGNEVLDFPKPQEFIRLLIEQGSTINQNDIILDFFSGSCTTAHSVLGLNSEDNGNRKFIMVQIPETTNNEEYGTISKISIERIKRSISEINAVQEKKIQETPLFQNQFSKIDLGFKAFQLANSNIKKWSNTQITDSSQTPSLFDNFINPVENNWKKVSLLYEILLLEGFPLTSKISDLRNSIENSIQIVSDTYFCSHKLFVCLDEMIDSNTIENLQLEKEDIFICLDSALSDEIKARMQDRFNIHVI